MFQGLLRRAEQSIDQVVAKYVGRATVAIPLIVAAGFATAAVSVKLVESYGPVIAYSIMAAGFAVLSLVTMAIVGTGNGTVETLSEPAAAADTADKTEEQADPGLDPSELLTPEVKAFLASTAPMALPSIARGVGRNLPLILILALVGYFISRFAGATTEANAEGTAAPEGETKAAA